MMKKKNQIINIIKQREIVVNPAGQLGYGKKFYFSKGVIRFYRYEIDWTKRRIFFFVAPILTEEEESQIIANAGKEIITVVDEDDLDSNDSSLNSKIPKYLERKIWRW